MFKDLRVVARFGLNITAQKTISGFSGTLVFPMVTLISGFRRDVDEICALLGYYA
jgi:hypothetical protein